MNRLWRDEQRDCKNYKADMNNFQNISRLSTCFQTEILSKSSNLLLKWRAISNTASNRIQIGSAYLSPRRYDDSSKTSLHDFTNTDRISSEPESSQESNGAHAHDVQDSDSECSINSANKSSSTLSAERDRVSPSSPCVPSEGKSEDNDFPSALKVVTVIPGKGKPPEPPITCCGTGCANCVWIGYAEEVKDYYKDGGEQAKKALEKIDDPSLKAFIKLELGL